MFNFHLCYVLIFGRKNNPSTFEQKHPMMSRYSPKQWWLNCKTGGRHLLWSFGLPLFWTMPIVINGVMMPLEVTKNNWALGVKQPLWQEFIPSLKLINIAPKHRLGPKKEMNHLPTIDFQGLTLCLGRVSLPICFMGLVYFPYICHYLA